MKRLLVNLPDELHEKIRREAFDNNISMSAIILGKIDLPPVSLEVTENPTPGGKITLYPMSKAANPCKHGFMKGLCKFGCK